MADDLDTSRWEPARLIPVSKTKNVEKEQRATSALLAVLSSVDEFGVAFTKPFGAPKGRLEAYTEVSFKHTAGKDVRPDGLIRVARGNRVWVALIEVKTGDDRLNSDQIEQYLDVAKEQEFDCVITISNQVAKIPGAHPTTVDKRKLNKVNLHHLSWSKVLTEAVLARSHRGIEDPDQAWILGELIRYLEHPNAGTFDFNDMGEHWVGVRDAIKNGTLRQTDGKAVEVAGKWEELLTFAALHLGRKLGDDVREILTAKERNDIGIRIENIVNAMVNERRLQGGIRIPNTVGDIMLSVNLLAQQIELSVSMDAPKTGRSSTRINWLLKQLKDTTLKVRLDSWAARSRESLSEMLDTARNDQALLVPANNKDIAKFTVTLSRNMGLKQRTGSKGSFIDSVIAAIDDFYRDVVQRLKEWQPPAPKLSSNVNQASVTPDVSEESIEISVADTREPVYDNPESKQSSSDTSSLESRNQVGNDT
ncbi:hypothetical protein JYT90_00670 [bacterium AH-315-P07]|nr:hypothetical protein [bacterium AH-315-P07]